MKLAEPGRAAIVGGLLVAQGWLLAHLVRQNGRFLLRMEALEARIFSNKQSRLRSAGLSVGSNAPKFTLPDLDGGERSLGEFLGGPLCVIFFNSQCSFCLELAPHLGRLPAAGPRVLIIASGEPAEYRRLVSDHHWSCDIVFQRGADVSRRYLADGTPSGYLLDAEGKIASPLAVGARALIRLGSAWLPRDDRVGGQPGYLAPEWFAENRRSTADVAGLHRLPAQECPVTRAGKP